MHLALGLVTAELAERGDEDYAPGDEDEPPVQQVPELGLVLPFGGAEESWVRLLGSLLEPASHQVSEPALVHHRGTADVATAPTVSG